MSASKKTIFVMITLAIVLIGVWIFIFGRLLVMKHAYVNESKLLLEERHKELSYLSIQNILRETEEERASLSNIFVNEDTVVSFLEELEDLGRTSGVVLELNSVKPEDTSLSFFFQVNGSFKDIYAFVKLIELLPHKMAVEKLDIRKAEGFIDGGKGALPLWQGEMTVSLRSFVVTKKDESKN